MKIFVSVVSHRQSALINELNCLDNLNDSINIVIKSNDDSDCFITLEKKSNITWINQSYGLGFGANNNYVYSFCRKVLDMQDDDIFIVLNPDVVISSEMIDKLISQMVLDDCCFACINLFRDEYFLTFDNSIRKFPRLFDFFSSFLFSHNRTIIDKKIISRISTVDWAAGSFLAFRAYHYSSLNGFDEGYFMYCEDIDICYRSKASSIPLRYFPDVKARHIGHHANRRIFSLNFMWHLRSIFRYLYKCK